MSVVFAGDVFDTDDDVITDADVVVAKTTLPPRFRCRCRCRSNFGSCRRSELERPISTVVIPFLILQWGKSVGDLRLVSYQFCVEFYKPIRNLFLLIQY